MAAARPMTSEAVRIALRIGARTHFPKVKGFTIALRFAAKTWRRRAKMAQVRQQFGRVKIRL
jgi:hypothetical protein